MICSVIFIHDSLNLSHALHVESFYLFLGLHLVSRSCKHKVQLLLQSPSLILLYSLLLCFLISKYCLAWINALVVAPILAFISVSLLHIFEMVPPKYFNCCTSCSCFPFISMCVPMLWSEIPVVIILLFSELIGIPYFLDVSSILHVATFGSCSDVPIRTMSSANLKLVIFLPLHDTPPSYSSIVYRGENPGGGVGGVTPPQS